MLILYAIADRSVPSPLPAGACGEPLVQLEADGVVGIAGAVESAPDPSEQAALAHARVVEALAERADPLLPARFGSLHPTPEALGEAPTKAMDFGQKKLWSSAPGDGRAGDGRAGDGLADVLSG